MANKGEQGDAGERGVPGREGAQGREGPQGREGREGRARAGSVGEAGVAGLAGAPGKAGAKGQTGRAGATGIGKVGAAILFVIVLLAIGLDGVTADQRSCRRQESPRAAQAAKYMIDGLRAEQIAQGETGTEKTVNLRYSAIYKQLAASVPTLHCGGLRPDVGPDNTKQVQALLDQARRGG